MLAFGPFVLDRRRRQLRRDGVPVRLTAKPLDVLAFLIENRGQTVSRDQLRETVWEGTSVSDTAVEQAVTKVRKALGDDPLNPTYVHTLWGKGYVFVGDVTTDGNPMLLDRQASADLESLLADGSTTRFSSPAVEDLDSRVLQPMGSQRPHLGHFVFVSSAYAALYAVGLVVETVYEFQRYGPDSVRAALIVFAWIAGTMGAALYVNRLRALRGRGGRNAAIGILTAGVLMLLAVAGPLLPASTITPFSYQGQTAQAAYLKNVVYFYALGVIFVVLPYDVIVSRECRGIAIGASGSGSGFLFPRPGLLFALLVGAAVWSLLSVARIFEHLLPGPHMNLYMNLLQIERVLGFGLAAECLVWYHLALARLDRRSAI